MSIGGLLFQWASTITIHTMELVWYMTYKSEYPQKNTSRHVPSELSTWFVEWICFLCVVAIDDWGMSVYLIYHRCNFCKIFYFSSLPDHFVWNLTFSTPYIFWNAMLCDIPSRGTVALIVLMVFLIGAYSRRY